MIPAPAGGLTIMQSAMTHLFAGVPVSDLDASIDRLVDAVLRATPRTVASERRCCGRSTNAPGASSSRTYSNGVRHVKVPDPDGNAIAFAEPPDER
jgi:hypothetical protein